MRISDWSSDVCSSDLRPPAVALLRHDPATGHHRRGRGMTTTIDGPRLPAATGTATSLVVLLHGYGADGNDLIELGAQWQRLLPDTAFVAPHAPGRIRSEGRRGGKECVSTCRARGCPGI